MILRFSLGGREFQTDTGLPHDISIPVRFDGPRPCAFGLPGAAAHVFESDGFVGDTRRGGSCNCYVLTLIAHGNGTHTECVGHIALDRISILAVLRRFLMPAALVTVSPAPASTLREDEAFTEPTDRVIGAQALEEAIEALGDLPPDFYRALVIRTAPNPPLKASTSYSQTNPPYFSRAGIWSLRRWGTEHLLCDLPSVDREQDGGRLAAHRIFWGRDRDSQPAATASGGTITELVYVADDVPDGPYLLDLQVAPIDLDAAPSRPVLYSLVELGAARPPPGARGDHP